MEALLFLIPVLVGLLTQFSKRFFNKDWDSSAKIEGYHLPRYGGMPSAHTSFALSLATLTLLADGVASSSFAIAIALVIFILDDALRMRVYLGHHGQALAQLIRKLPPEEQNAFPHLEDRLGHTVPEVIGGALFGIVATIAIFWIFVP